MKDVGGSTFAVWWAYKFEVREAVPYNADLINMVGVITAINSDDSEMARRLNQEALQLVTSNTAEVRGIRDLTGTIFEGKDANLVVSEGDLLDMRTSKVKYAFIKGR